MIAVVANWHFEYNVVNLKGTRRNAYRQKRDKEMPAEKQQ